MFTYPKILVIGAYNFEKMHGILDSTAKEPRMEATLDEGRIYQKYILT